MRVFIAVEVPEEIVSELKKIQNQFPDEKLKLVKSFHLTLKFLGEITEDKVEAVKTALSNINFNKFKAELNDIGVFPNPDYIRVVWVGVSQNDFINLQKNIDNEISKLGFKKEKKFSPHLTLARVKFIKYKESFRQTLNSIHVEKKQFEVNEFKLIKSTLTSQGSIYDDLAFYKSN